MSIIGKSVAAIIFAAVLSFFAFWPSSPSTSSTNDMSGRIVGFWSHDLNSTGDMKVHMIGTIEYAADGESSVSGKMQLFTGRDRIEWLYTTKGTWKIEDDWLIETTDQMKSRVVAVNGEPPGSDLGGIPKLEDVFPLGKLQYSKILSLSGDEMRLLLRSSNTEIVMERATERMTF